MRFQRTAEWLVAGGGLVVGVLAWAPPASGQLSLGGFSLEGDAEGFVVPLR